MQCSRGVFSRDAEGRILNHIPSRKHKESLLTYEELLRQLSYDPDIGIFRWRITNLRHLAGERAGSRYDSKGRRRIEINNVRIKEHRLAVFYMTGKWPIEEVDHKNRIGFDNRWENLREATNSQNKHNSVLRTDNTFGHRAIQFVRGKWSVRIGHNRKMIELGLFDTLEEALIVRNEKYQELYGEFYCDT